MGRTGTLISLQLKLDIKNVKCQLQRVKNSCAKIFFPINGVNNMEISVKLCDPFSFYLFFTVYLFTKNVRRTTRISQK
jgi:hypothetical protein